MLEITNLHARLADGREILRGIDLSAGPGGAHAIMGPNGSGKSTFAAVLAGRDGYEVTAGSVAYLGRDLLAMPADERARDGLFLGLSVPGRDSGREKHVFSAHGAERAAPPPRRARTRRRPVSARGAGQAQGARHRRGLVAARGQCRLFRRREKAQRNFPDGDAGAAAILDETDSGLDIDALRVVAAGVNRQRAPDRAIVIITHYQRLLDYVEPDRIHVLQSGRIVETGDKSLAAELERRGYGALGDA